MLMNVAVESGHIDLSNIMQAMNSPTECAVFLRKKEGASNPLRGEKIIGFA